MINRIILASLVFIPRSALALCADGSHDDCCRAPGAPSAGFNQACTSGTIVDTQLPDSSYTSSGYFAVTEEHAFFREQTVSSPVTTYVFRSTHGGGSCATSGARDRIDDTQGVVTFDGLTSTNPDSLIYVDQSGSDLAGYEITSETFFKPTATASNDQVTPAASVDGMSFAWASGGDIYACIGAECYSGGAIQVTSSSDVEANPRIDGMKVVWENLQTKEVRYADLEISPPIVEVNIGDGRHPDIGQDHIVYEKWVPEPHSSCTWNQQKVIYYYGPLSGTPSNQKIQSTAYWGAGNFLNPRIVGEFVIFQVDYFFSTTPKTVIGAYPIELFGTTGALKEIDDAGYGQFSIANVAGYRDADAGVYRTLYRRRATSSPYSAGPANLRCCQLTDPGSW